MKLINDVIGVKPLPITGSVNRRADQAAARNELRELFAGNDKPLIYTILRHVTASGLNRDISLFYDTPEGIRPITHTAARALGYKLISSNGFNAIRQHGGGMDLGFNLVYNLSAVIYKDLERGGYHLAHRWL
jgi:hypothetical protein